VIKDVLVICLQIQRESGSLLPCIQARRVGDEGAESIGIAVRKNILLDEY